MKKLLFPAIMLLLPNTRDLYAQWQGTTTLTTTGNVGIGRSPRTMLDIWGGVLSVTGSDQNGTAYVTSSGGTAYFCNNTLGNGLTVTSTGNVGIGVTNPTAKLEIANGPANALLRVGVSSNRANCSTQMLNSLAVIGNDNMATTTNGAVAWDYYNNGTSPSWSGTILEHVGTGVSGNLYGLPAANQGQLVFQNVANAVVGTNGSNLFISPASQLSTAFLTDGSVGIGTTSTQGYKLAVNGSAIFTKVVVKLYNTWPDYVFDTSYKLPSLRYIESYVANNKHLPDMPTTEETETTGIDIGKNQTLLLKKVEELTLYMIDLNKKMDILSKENDELKKKVNSATQ